MALLAAGVVGVFASIPLGWSGLMLVGVVTLGSEILAALTVPGLASFRTAVDRTQQQQLRAQRRIQLLADISQYGDNQALATYQHMYARVQALYQTASNSRTSLTRVDVDKLEDLTVDYLGLCAVSLSLKQRKENPSEALVNQRIASLQLQLQDPALGADEQRQLRAALTEYTETLQRSRRLAARRSALEATLLSIPDKLEEVYQLVITSPYASDMGSQLEESLSRLRIAEEVAAEFDDPNVFAPPSASQLKTPVQATTPSARKTANSVKT